MKEKYIINGSNTTYKVWGILVSIFGIFAAILWLGSLTVLFLNIDNMEFWDKFSPNLLGTFIFFFVSLIIILIKIDTATLLESEFISTKSGLILNAVLYFLSALAWLIMIILLVLKLFVAKYIFLDGCFILVSILKLAWDIATGVLLISKQNKAVPNVSKPTVLPQIKTENDNL